MSSLQQKVTLVGCGLSYFRETVANIANIAVVMESGRPRGSAVIWKPFSFRGDHAIEFSNRFFMPSQAGDVSDVVRVTKEVDPIGLVRSRAGNRRHTSDNVVQYWRLVRTADPACRYVIVEGVSVRQILTLHISYL